MMTRIFSVEAEIEKLKCVFRNIKKDWEYRTDLLVEFKDYKEVAPAGETIDRFMQEMLFKNHFCDFVIFAAVLKNSAITFLLAISEDDESSELQSAFRVCFNRAELEPDVIGDVAIKDVRDMIWNVYQFFNSSGHAGVNAEDEFKRLLKS